MWRTLNRQAAKNAKWKLSGNNRDASQFCQIVITVDESKNLRVTIGEGKRASGFVAAGWQIFKSSSRIHNRHKHGVVDGALILIGENE